MSTAQQPAFDAAALSLELSAVVVFRAVAQGEVLSAFHAFLACEDVPEARAVSYADFAFQLYAHGCDLGAYLLDAVLTDDNAYIRTLAAGNVPSPVMAQCADRELLLFERLSRLDPAALTAHARCPLPLPAILNTPADFRLAFDAQAKNVGARGYGIYARYGMFRLQDGRITPVAHADPIAINSLIGYERERQLVIDNTRALIEGRPAANVLLCGDAGTGKSSTVKAVANRFFRDGVRLLELQKNQLYLLPALMGELSGNPLKFILFIDDLSFQKNDDSFGELKAILEGSAAAKAPNVVIYATSNRRHLVKETFSDREGDDVHRQDTMQELVSLSERFGLTVLFGKPDKALYLKIVRGLADAFGIEMDAAELELRAESFALHKGGRSARAAEQFIDSLR